MDCHNFCCFVNLNPLNRKINGKIKRSKLKNQEKKINMADTRVFQNEKNIESVLTPTILNTL